MTVFHTHCTVVFIFTKTIFRFWKEEFLLTSFFFFIDKYSIDKFYWSNVRGEHGIEWMWPQWVSRKYQVDRQLPRTVQWSPKQAGWTWYGHADGHRAGRRVESTAEQNEANKSRAASSIPTLSPLLYSPLSSLSLHFQHNISPQQLHRDLCIPLDCSRCTTSPLSIEPLFTLHHRIYCHYPLFIFSSQWLRTEGPSCPRGRDPLLCTAPPNPRWSGAGSPPLSVCGLSLICQSIQRWLCLWTLCY